MNGHFSACGILPKKLQVPCLALKQYSCDVERAGNFHLPYFCFLIVVGGAHVVAKSIDVPENQSTVNKNIFFKFETRLPKTADQNFHVAKIWGKRTWNPYYGNNPRYVSEYLDFYNFKRQASDKTLPKIFSRCSLRPCWSSCRCSE